MRFLKLTAVSFCAAIILCAIAVFPQRICFNGGENYVFYCGTSSADCREVYASFPPLERVALKDICGESAEFFNFELEPFLEKYGAEVVFTEEGDGYKNYYCRADLPYSAELYGEKINLHVCVRGKNAKAGSPIIFGGY